MTYREEKFDAFIEFNDRSLNKDTSTISTITPSSQLLGQPPSLNSHKQSIGSIIMEEDINEKETVNKQGMISPILSTPTKSNRNSVSLDKQPLKTITSDRPVSLIQSKSSSKSQNSPATSDDADSSSTSIRSNNHRRTVSVSSDYRTGTVSAKKKGFNLNLALNHDIKKDPTNIATNRPRTPSNSFSPLQRKLSVVSRPEQIATSTSANNNNNNVSTRARSSSLKQVEDNETFNKALRELAAKEMRIFEIKSEIKLLTETLEREQDDLARLRNQISTNLYKDLNSMKSPPTKQQQQPLPAPHISKDSPITSTPRKRPSNLDTNILLPITSNNQITPNSPEQNSITSPTIKEVKTSRRISQYFSKPITFINQFDQILQNEFEKLNTSTTEEEEESSTNRENILNSTTSDIITPASSKHTSPLKTPNGTRERSKTDEVLKTVSNSIWSFMSEVKSGLLGEEENAFLNQQQQQQNDTFNDESEDKMLSSSDISINDSMNASEQEMVTIRRR